MTIGQSDAMPGYRRYMLEITDPEVTKANAVAGKVFPITETELHAADRYEVSDHRRIEVVLKSGLLAWVYVSAAVDGLFQPFTP